MAGRGRHATLPAWMTAGGGAAAAAAAATAAPGSSGAGTTAQAAPRAPLAPGSGGYPEPSRAPLGAGLGGPMPGGGPIGLGIGGGSGSGGSGGGLGAAVGGGQQAAPRQQPAAAAGGGGGGGNEGWTEHTAPDGRKYYYNTITKTSVWTKPEPLMTPEERARAAAAKAAAQPAPAAAAQQQPIPVYATKEEARDAFRELLASAGVGGDDTWDGALRRIINDPRYNALGSLGERRQAFNEYVQARRNEERDQARRRAAEAKEAFSAMLDEAGLLRPGDSYRTAKALLQDDPRWQAVPNEAAREELFDSFMRGFRARAEERERAERKEKEAALREVLKEAGFKASTPWRKAAARLEGDPAFEALDKVDRLRLFQELILALEDEERADRDRAREEERREERKRREAFRALLLEHAAEGRINPKTRWRDYGPTVEGEPAYVELCRNKAGSRPKELFTDLVEDLEGEYEEAKAVFRDAARAAGWAAAADSSWDEFREQLEAGGAQLEQAGGKGLAGLRDSFRRIFFEEAVGAARLKVEEAERRARRARDSFERFLRSARGLYADTPWDEFEDAFRDEPEFKEVGAEVAKEMFDEHLEKLKRKEERRRAAASGGGGGDDDDERHSGGSHKHKKKRSSRHDDDHKSHKSSKRHRHGRSRTRSRTRSADRSRERRSRRDTGDDEGAADAAADGRPPAANNHRGAAGSDSAEEGEV